MESYSKFDCIIIGGGVTGIARYLSNDNLNLDFFFWAGIVFIAIGIFKIVMGFITRMPKSGKEKDYAKATLKPLEPQEEPEDEMAIYPKYCPSCKLLYTKESNFCSRCGSQLYIKP